jgi:hypothetical protein
MLISPLPVTDTIVTDEQCRALRLLVQRQSAESPLYAFKHDQPTLVVPTLFQSLSLSLQTDHCPEDLLAVAYILQRY